MQRLFPCAGLFVLLACAGCGSSSSSSSTHPSAAAASAPATGKYGSSTPAAASAPTTGATTVGLRSSKLGKYLVDGSGRTVYLFLADKSGKSACYGACAKVWVPLAASAAPTGGTGVSSAKLATLTRTDGVTQVLYNGHPLYHYDDDHHVGQIQGQGKKEFGGEWYVLSPAGAKLEAHGS